MTPARLVLLIVMATRAVAQSSESTMHIDFNAFEIDQPPPGFSTALTGGGGPVAWVVQDDPLKAGAGKVLVQTSADSTSHRFPLCIADSFSAKDLDLSVRFAPIAGKVDRAAGLVWRYRDPDNYYVVRANALEGNVVLYKVEAGKRTDLKPTDAGVFSYGVKAPVSSGTWSELRITARGKRFAVSLNGKHLFDVEDATFPNAGKVGLWTKADSVTAFDDLRAETLDATAAAQ
jgi:hypothetical protein